MSPQQTVQVALVFIGPELPTVSVALDVAERHGGEIVVALKALAWLNARHDADLEVDEHDTTPMQLGEDALRFKMTEIRNQSDSIAAPTILIVSPSDAGAIPHAVRFVDITKPREKS